jgi:hypothetical protein
MSEALDYDKSVIKTIHHIEDILVKFALQNYAAAGAVFLAYFTQKMSLRMAAAVIVALGVVFTLAICSNIMRYRLFWKLHRIARDHWLAGQSELREAYRADADCEKYLMLKALPLIAFWPVIIINLLPAAGAVLLFWRRSS